MKTYRLVTTSVLFILAFAIAAPLITLASMPGSELNVEGYLRFLFPAALIFALLLLLPRFSQADFNLLAAGGAGALLLWAIFFQTGPIPIVLYILGAEGLFLVKKKFIQK